MCASLIKVKYYRYYTSVQGVPSLMQGVSGSVPALSVSETDSASDWWVVSVSETTNEPL